MNVLYVLTLIYTVNAKCNHYSIGDCIFVCNCGLCITDGNIECISVNDKCDGCFSHYNYSCREEGDSVLELITWILIMLSVISSCIGIVLVLIERAFNNRFFDVENV